LSDVTRDTVSGGAAGIDVKAILGTDGADGRRGATAAEVAEVEARTKAQLRLKPRGAGATVAMPGSHVHFPEPDAVGGGGCAGCTVQ
jgi:hypothetical protein